MERVFKVAKIRCEGCAETITKALAGVAGVTSTRIGISEKEVRVELDPTRVDETRVREVLAAAGFPPA